MGSAEEAPSPDPDISIPGIAGAPAEASDGAAGGVVMPGMLDMSGGGPGPARSAAGATAVEAMCLANLAASIVVRRIGTSVTNPTELSAALAALDLPLPSPTV